MTEAERKQILVQGWVLHDKVEKAYLENPAFKGDAAWPEKRRLLMADMALHLLDTALTPGDLPQDNLRNNIHAILTIADPFLPDAGLGQATEKLFNQREISGGGDS